MNPELPSLACAKAAAVFSVVYAGVNIFQLTAQIEDVRGRAQQFATIAGDHAHTVRLWSIRVFFYLGVPLAFLGMLECAGLAPLYLFSAAAKFLLSAVFGFITEQRLIRGGEYRVWDHHLSRFDAILNLLVAAGAIGLILRLWY